MINLHWLELPMSRTNFHGPKDVRLDIIKEKKRLHYDEVRGDVYSGIEHIAPEAGSPLKSLKQRTQQRKKIEDSVSWKLFI